MNIPVALQKIFPGVNLNRGPLLGLDYTLGSDGIGSWTPQWSLPVGESYPKQPAAAALAAALQPSIARLAQAAAAAAFDALPPGKQALWEPVRESVNAALVKNDLSGAMEILETVPEIYDGMEADRAAFIALFQPAPTAKKKQSIKKGSPGKNAAKNSHAISKRPSRKAR